MTSERKETHIDLEWNVVDASNGFSMDFGGSVMKIVYIHKDDWIGDKTKRKSPTCPVRLVNFAREEMEKSFDYVNERIFIKRKSPDDTPLVYITGVGGAEYVKDIEEKFKVTAKVLTEIDCFIESNKYFCEVLTQDQLFYPPETKAVKGLKALAKAYETLMTTTAESGQTAMAFESDMQSVKLSDEKGDVNEATKLDPKDVYPCLFAMCGSGGGIMLLTENGAFQFVEALFRIGRYLYGLGSILTGAKSFGELMDLAEKGDERKVHTYVHEFLLEKSEDSIYSSLDFEFENYIFPFGKGVQKTKKDFRREDLARAIVSVIAGDVATTVYTCAERLAIPPKRIFLSGNFVSHQLLRHHLTLECNRRHMESHFYLCTKFDLPPLHFLRHGAHYGALGAFLNSSKQFSENLAKTAQASTDLRLELKHEARHRCTCKKPQ